ncbi:MAG: F0F1 ATP synthase subunit delta [Treponema sp.]|jgi:hypothetical protein|nr:F0F1 ATP synthase subunit delta [Treponema sp.]
MTPDGRLSGRWAAAFTGACGVRAESGLDCLRTMAAAVKAIPGGLFGQDAALRLEALLRGALGDAGFSAEGRGAGDKSPVPSVPETEYAVRFLSLLVRKNLFRRHIDSIVRQIEKRLDGQKGILEVIAECAAPPDSGFEEYLAKEIQKKTGAAGIKLRTRRKPELLGGYRLRIDGLCVDASLKGLLAGMTKELEHD